MIDFKTKKPTIMLVGAGRRYSFVERLQAGGFNVMSYELDKNPPISRLCYCFQAVKDWNDARRDLELIQETYPYDYILPLNDQATYELAGRPHVIGHDVNAAKICYDKKLFEIFMLKYFKEFYPSPFYFDEVIVKPRYGASSKGIRYYPKSHGHGIVFDEETEVMQRKITGKEYSVDAYFSRSGEFVGAVPRTRERVAGGEVIDSKVDLNVKLLTFLTDKIGTRLKMTGPACFQYMVQTDGEKELPYLFEINARFGGGNILSLEAGFDMIKMLHQEYWLEEQPYYGSIKDGLYMRRVNREVFF